MSVSLYIQEACIICVEDFGLDRKINSIACGHVFCRVCLDNIEPSVCPVCREPFDEEDIECIGPWEEEPMQTTERKAIDVDAEDYVDEDSEWDPAASEHIHDEELTWTPSDADREADAQAREELGLPQDEDEERWNDRERDTSVAPDYVGRGLSLPSEVESNLGWTLLDSEYAEDRAAWEELGLRA